MDARDKQILMNKIKTQSGMSGRGMIAGYMEDGTFGGYMEDGTFGGRLRQYKRMSAGRVPIRKVHRVRRMSVGRVPIRKVHRVKRMSAGRAPIRKVHRVKRMSAGRVPIRKVHRVKRMSKCALTGGRKSDILKNLTMDRKRQYRPRRFSRNNEEILRILSMY